MDLRCTHKLHGKLLDGTVLEVKCNSRFCGANQGVVVLHRFDMADGGRLIATRRFSDPAKNRSKDG